MTATPHYHAGFRDRLLDRDPFLLAVWYPAQANETPVRHMGVASMAARNAPVAAGGPFPLVVFSHGSEGHRFNQFWLAEYLARRGFIVIAPQHAGDNYLDMAYARTLPLMVRRPAEISRALDVVLAQGDIGPAIDRDHIYALGHSAGGATVLELAGWQFDVSAWCDYCERHGDQDRIICDAAPDADAVARYVAATGGPVIRARDERISAVVALAPALGVAATVAGFADVTVPILFVEAETDEILPDAVNAARFRHLLQGRARFVKIKGAGHYSFLPPCTPFIAQHHGHLCRDFGKDRRQIHKSVEQIVTSFLMRVRSGEIQGR
ncbi:MAG: hypothetical protein ABID63_07930 [Pseudomonadota bacterium]